MSYAEPVWQPFHFAARELDLESGLYYNRVRYYDPSLARFLSEDPIGLAGGVNPYVYAGNDPVDFADPAGLKPCTPQQIAEGAIQANFSDGNKACMPKATLPAVSVSARAPTDRKPAGPRSGWKMEDLATSALSTAKAGVASVGDFLGDKCTTASFGLAYDLVSGAVMVAGGVEVLGAAMALNTAQCALGRAVFYAAVNGGRSSLRRLAAKDLEFATAVVAFNVTAHPFGAQYASGLWDDWSHGADAKAFIPFAGLVDSAPAYLNACF